jgi:argininosuccinate lyase
VANGVPFREAHERVGAIVASLEADGRTFADVKPDEWPDLDSGLGPETAELLSPESAVRRRITPGGPAPESIARQLQTLRARLSRS